MFRIIQSLLLVFTVVSFFSCTRCLECTYVEPTTGIRKQPEEMCGKKAARDEFFNNFTKEAEFFGADPECKEESQFFLQ
jgi:hypothetical protein